MEFQFARYTEITDYALKHFPNQYKGYSRLFICPDVCDAHLIRVLPEYGYRYEKNPNTILVEYEKFPNDNKGQRLTLNRLRKLLTDDDLSNWDYHVFGSMEDVIESIDQGYGIINLKEPEFT